MSQYVLEWSRTSNNFHIQPLETTLAKNQECFIDDRSHDWILIMVGTHETVCTMAENHRSRLIDREKVTALMKTQTDMLAHYAWIAKIDKAYAARSVGEDA